MGAAAVAAAADKITALGAQAAAAEKAAVHARQGPADAASAATAGAARGPVHNAAQARKQAVGAPAAAMKAAPAAAVKAVAETADRGAASSSGGSAAFDALAASLGAQRDQSKGDNGSGSTDRIPTEAVLKQHALKQMGEVAGVARAVAVVLPSDTSALGRKCANASCLAREGVGGLRLKRCGACKVAAYCSVHCQTTHWRDSHAKVCKQLATEARQNTT